MGMNFISAASSKGNSAISRAVCALAEILDGAVSVQTQKEMEGRHITELDLANVHYVSNSTAFCMSFHVKEGCTIGPIVFWYILFTLHESSVQRSFQVTFLHL